MKTKIIQKYVLEIYPCNYIQKAILDYKNICKIDMVFNNNVVECTFYDSLVDLEITVKEFSNYLIELINSRNIIC